MQTNGSFNPVLLVPGDIIVLKTGLSGNAEKGFVIKEIISQDFWGKKEPDKPWKDYGYYVEFIDTRNHYHYWKEQYDGGYIVKK